MVTMPRLTIEVASSLRCHSCGRLLGKIYGNITLGKITLNSGAHLEIVCPNRRCRVFNTFDLSALLPIVS